MVSAAEMVKKNKRAILFFTPLAVAAAAALLYYASEALCSRNTKSASGEEVIPMGGKDLLNMSNLYPAERDLYRTLSKNGGAVTDEMILTVEGSRHWDELILKKDGSPENIAKKYGIPTEDLLRINGIDGGKSRDRDVAIYVPRGTEHIEETSAFVKEMKRREAEFLTQKKMVSVTAYIVTDRDTVWSIAELFGLNADTILGSNSPEKISSLLPGTVLRIPDRDGIFVKVREGESIERLSSLYGTKTDQVCAANGIAADRPLPSGKELFLPGASYAAVIETEDGTVRIASGREHLLRDTLIWPVRGELSGLFGWRDRSNATAGSFHSGLDIVAPYGRAVVSAMDGVVAYSGWMRGYGRTAVVDHADGVTTLYGHCSELSVKKGDPVYSGQPIAYVGSTGKSTGSHLHFEVRKNGFPVDPLSVLR